MSGRANLAGEMLKVGLRGSFRNLEKFLKRKRKDPRLILEYYGQAGVDALMEATPKDTGLTAASWYYEITEKDGVWTVSWNNSNIQNGIPIAILIQMGHGTGTGGYVEGIDYINPALREVFKQFSIKIGKEILG